MYTLCVRSDLFPNPAVGILLVLVIAAEIGLLPANQDVEPCTAQRNTYSRGSRLFTDLINVVFINQKRTPAGRSNSLVSLFLLTVYGFHSDLIKLY